MLVSEVSTEVGCYCKMWSQKEQSIRKCDFCEYEAQSCEPKGKGAKRPKDVALVTLALAWVNSNTHATSFMMVV